MKIRDSSVFICSFYFNLGFFNVGIYNFQLPLKKCVRNRGDGLEAVPTVTQQASRGLAMDMVLPFEMHFYKCSWLLAGGRRQ